MQSSQCHIITEGRPLVKSPPCLGRWRLRWPAWRSVVRWWQKGVLVFRKSVRNSTIRAATLTWRCKV
ncbi:hypothetical protein TIFTF001_007393 [Ficus carica]|uniref:Uncharacterized protein n=1 Tax=Ficus carica TaxID=3494 RepID=A0AA87ZQB2_FICCA|nr:hypothetical protein TIFTF001_007393 [Ficus carica]